MSSVEIYPITSTATSAGQVTAFICAKCLSSANSMRLHVKALLSKIIVSPEVIQQFMRLQTGDVIDKDAARVAIIRMFDKGEPFFLQSAAHRFGNHGPVECRYNAGWIFVVTKGTPGRIVTIERGSKRRSGKKAKDTGTARRGRKKAKKLKKRTGKTAVRRTSITEVRRLNEHRRRLEQSSQPAKRDETTHQVFGDPTGPACVDKSFETPFERRG